MNALTQIESQEGNSSLEERKILLERCTETHHGANEQHGPDGCHRKELWPDITYSCIPEEDTGAKFHIVRGWGELHDDLEESGHRLYRGYPTAKH